MINTELSECGQRSLHLLTSGCTASAREQVERPLATLTKFYIDATEGQSLHLLRTRQGKARQGKARQGKARQGKARQGKARQDNARQRKARQRKATQRKATQGTATRTTKGKGRQGRE